ncbi:MAG TPA: hypothetical protein VLW50_33645 [Streptosporangiaceae bacterium]|nr:hypothetical protein [Streptosporangiaceae bacterium]
MIGPGRRPILGTRAWLVLICAGLPGLEAVVLIAVGLRGSVPLAPGATAPAPYGVYHDLRFLLTYHSSWTAFAAEAAAMLCWRSALDCALIQLAWPAGQPRPAGIAVLRRTAVFTGVAAILLLPSAAAVSAMDVMPVSDLFLAGMPVAVIIATLTCHGEVNSWWRRLPPVRAVMWSLGTFAVITAGGAVAAAVPTWAAPLAAACTGLFSARAYAGIARACVTQRNSFPIPLAPIGLAAMAAVVVVSISFAIRVGGAADHATYQVSSDTPESAEVLLVSGYHSAWNGSTPMPIGSLPVERFSYRGLDAGGYPLRYSPKATQQPLSRTVRLLAAQVETIYRHTGHRVAIVADSEGSLAVQTYVATVTGAPVSKIVLLDPLVDPGRGYFPPANAQGWGVATGAILRGLSAAIGATTPLHIDADGPFIRSVDDHGPVLQGLFTCPPQGVREAVLFSLADAVASPFTARVAAPSGVVVRLHGYLLDDEEATHLIAGFIQTGRLPADPRRAEADQLVRAAAAAWQAPPLAPSLVPQWRGEPLAGCSAKRQALTEWLR